MHLKKIWSKEKSLALALFLGMTFIFTVWVHHAFQGNYWGPFLPGGVFGIPNLERSMGMYPISKVGWDGQFYYYQSNDIFALKDAANHIDNPAYRYQRIGMPLMAATLSTLLGFKATPPLLYHLLQIVFVSIGFYFLLKWLKEHKISTFYALAWPFSVGVLNALAYGMPDPVGDALFLMAVLFTLQKKLWSYIVVATLMVLVREGYAVFSGFIALFSFFGGITWNYANKIITRLAVFIPVVVVSLWMVYVTVRFGKNPILAGKGLANITDWPFFGAIKSFLDALYFPTLSEAVFKIFGCFILLLAIVIVVKRLKEHMVWYAILAYLFLIATLGTTIWMDYSGYMKALGSVIIILIISLAKYRSAFIRILLVVLIIHGLGYNLLYKKNSFYVEYAMPARAYTSQEGNDRLKDYSFKMIAPQLNSTWEGYRGFFSFAHQSVRTLDVQVTNTSTQDWLPFPRDGLHAINMSYRWLDSSGKKVIFDGLRTPINQIVPKGTSFNASIKVSVPPPGEYVLQLSVMQEGVAWFYRSVFGGGRYRIKIQ